MTSKRRVTFDIIPQDAFLYTKMKDCPHRSKSSSIPKQNHFTKSQGRQNSVLRSQFLSLQARPTPAHLTSVQAEQILATACENESDNAKRMRVGLEPVSQPMPTLPAATVSPRVTPHTYVRVHASNRSGNVDCLIRERRSRDNLCPGVGPGVPHSRAASGPSRIIVGSPPFL